MSLSGTKLHAPKSFRIFSSSDPKNESYLITPAFILPLSKSKSLNYEDYADSQLKIRAEIEKEIKRRSSIVSIIQPRVTRNIRYTESCPALVDLERSSNGMIRDDLFLKTDDIK